VTGAASLLLAIDVGTGSARAGLLRTDGGIVALAAKEHATQVPRHGLSEQDPEAWWQGTVESVGRVLRESGADPAAICGIGVCGQMHGPVPIDAEGRTLLDAVQLWDDKRAEDLAQAFNAAADEPQLRQRTANPPAASWTGFKIAWIARNQPEVYARARAFLVPKDYINFRLTGAIATDHSEASGSYLLDCRSLAYDGEIAGRLGVDIEKLPPSGPAHRVVGAVTPSAAAATGLRPGTPVVAGCGDFIAALLGTGVVGSGVGADMTGTSNLVSMQVERPLIHPAIMNLHAAVPGWIAFTIIDSGGGALRWARSIFAHPDEDYAAIDALAAATPPGAEGLLFLPHLTGERLGGGANARAQFFGVTARHRRGHFLRAVMEGVALASRRNLAQMHGAGAGFDRIIVAGGGARSALWMQIKADAYGLPVMAPQSPEGGLIGGAMLAGLGAGLFSSADEAVSRMVRLGPSVAPRPAVAETYARAAEIFEKLDQNARTHYDAWEGSVSWIQQPRPGRAGLQASQWRRRRHRYVAAARQGGPGGPPSPAPASRPCFYAAGLMPCSRAMRAAWVRLAAPSLR
jgi:xylulokinase